MRHHDLEVTRVVGRPAVGMIAMGFGRSYPGGAEHQAELLSYELARMGRRVLIYAPMVSVDMDRRPRRHPLMRVVPVPCLGLPKVRTATFLPMLALTQVVPGFEHPSILHSHMAWYQAAAAQVVSGRSGARTIVKFACSGQDGELATMSRSSAGRRALTLIRGADRVVALTSAVAHELRVNGFDDRRIRLIPNGTLLPATAEPAPDLTTLPGPIVLFAGRLTEQKGISNFLEAWAHVMESSGDATLVIAGEGPLRHALESRAARHDLAGRVRLLGHRTDMDAVLAASTLVVIPSRSEGMSNVALQALAVGRPVVGFDIAGVRDVVCDGRMLVPAGDHRRLAEVVVAMLADHGLLSEAAAMGRERVAQQFSIGVVATRYEEVYHELGG